jgi:hypothetical protein
MGVNLQWEQKAESGKQKAAYAAAAVLCGDGMNPSSRSAMLCIIFAASPCLALSCA